MWIEHDGKGMPVSAETLVLFRFADGEESTEWKPAGICKENWTYSSWAGFCNISHYRVLTGVENEVD